MWKYNLQWETGKSGTGTYINKVIHIIHIFYLHNRQTVHKMFLHHFVKFSDPGEVHHFIPFYQQLVIFLKLFNLLLCQCHAKCLTSIF